MKKISIIVVYKESKLVIQAYNNYKKKNFYLSPYNLKNKLEVDSSINCYLTLFKPFFKRYYLSLY